MFRTNFLIFAIVSFLFASASSQNPYSDDQQQQQDQDGFISKQQQQEMPVEGNSALTPEKVQDVETKDSGQAPAVAEGGEMPQVQETTSGSQPEENGSSTSATPQPQEEASSTPGGTSQPQEKVAEPQENTSDTPGIPNPKEKVAESTPKPQDKTENQDGVTKSKPKKTGSSSVFDSEEYLKPEGEEKDQGKTGFLGMLNVVGDLIEITSSTVSDVMDDITHSQGRKVTDTIQMVARDILEGLKDVAAELTHKP